MLVLAINLLGDGLLDLKFWSANCKLDIILDVQNVQVEIPVSAWMLHPVCGIPFSVVLGRCMLLWENPVVGKL